MKNFKSRKGKYLYKSLIFFQDLLPYNISEVVILVLLPPQNLAQPTCWYHCCYGIIMCAVQWLDVRTQQIWGSGKGQTLPQVFRLRLAASSVASSVASALTKVKLHESDESQAPLESSVRNFISDPGFGWSWSKVV
jgi:hypothetical protein